jgi:hypothetical protein
MAQRTESMLRISKYGHNSHRHFPAARCRDVPRHVLKHQRGLCAMMHQEIQERVSRTIHKKARFAQKLFAPMLEMHIR